MDWIIRFYNITSFSMNWRDKDKTTEQTTRQHTPCGKPLNLHPLNYKPVTFYLNYCDHFILLILFKFFLYYFGLEFVTKLVTYDFFGFCSASATTLELRVKGSTTKGVLLEILLSDRHQTFSPRENTLTWKKKRIQDGYSTLWSIKSQGRHQSLNFNDCESVYYLI